MDVKKGTTIRKIQTKQGSRKLHRVGKKYRSNTMNKFRYFPHIFSGTMVSQMRTIGVIVLVILLGACAKDSTPVGPDTVTYSPPKAGSTFRYDTYSTDTTASLPIEGSHDTTLHTVLQSGMSFAGKTNVTMISTVNKYYTDTTYISYESNGDISVLNPFNLEQNEWVIMPVGSKTSTSIVLFDTTNIVSGVSNRNKISAEISNAGTENLTVNGKTISIIKLKSATIFATTKAGVTSSVPGEKFTYFAPSLGYIVKTNQPVQVSPFGGKKQEGSVEMLLDYTLK
jgi:hypothetical protein